MKRCKLDKEKYKMPYVRREGTPEGVMELSPVLEEISSLKKSLMHLAQGSVLTLSEGFPVSLSLSMCLL